METSNTIKTLPTFLKWTEEILNWIHFNSDIVCVSSYGNSLGMLRQGSFIPWDRDFDVFSSAFIDHEFLSKVKRALPHIPLTIDVRRLPRHTFWKLSMVILTDRFDIDFFGKESFVVFHERVNNDGKGGELFDAMFKAWHYKYDRRYDVTFRYSNIDSIHLADEYKFPKALMFNAEGKEVITTPSNIACDGCFDPLHAGHIDYLQRAKNISPSGFMTVFIPSDTLMLKYKGKCVLSSHDRASALKGIRYVDSVIVIDEWSDVWMKHGKTFEIFVSCVDYNNPESKSTYYSGIPEEKMLWIPRSFISVSSSSLCQTPKSS